MSIKPLGDHVVVKLLEKEEVTASGIVLPDTIDKKEKAEGKVVAVGPGKMLETGARGAMEVEVGDTVLIKKWGGDEVEVKGEDYKIISAEDILAILE
ncbi:MAG: co-chaperone GroES [Patescibacteria group bacterium]